MDPIDRVSTLADALPFLEQELALDRQALQQFRGGRPIPPNLKASIDKLTNAIDRGAAAAEDIARKLAPLAQQNLGLIGMLGAAREAQQEVERMCQHIFNVTDALRAVRQVITP